MHDGLFDLWKQHVLLFDQVVHVLAEEIGVPHTGVLCPVALQVTLQRLVALLLWRIGDIPELKPFASIMACGVPLAY